VSAEDKESGTPLSLRRIEMSNNGGSSVELVWRANGGNGVTQWLSI
jgi:hypothetical protein